jgi:hypothetical protein
MKGNFAFPFLSGFLWLSLLAVCAIASGPCTSAAQSTAEPEAASTPCPWKGQNEQETEKLCEDSARWDAAHPQAQPTPCPYQGADRLLWAKYCGSPETRGLDPKVIDDAYQSVHGVPMPSTTYVTMPDGTIAGSDGSVIVPQDSH